VVWYRDVINCYKRREACPQTVYVYGRNNADVLSKLGFKVVLVDDDPFPDGRVDRREDDVDIRPWHYKLELIKAALRDHGNVLYCDWDVTAKLEREAEALDLLEDVDLALTAYSYARRRDAFFDLPRTGRARRINVTGACMYLNGTEFVDRILKYMKEKNAWHDEVAMNNVIDAEHGGWPGEREWLRTYENPAFVVPDHRSPWGRAGRTGRNGASVLRRTPVPFVWYDLFWQK
jgi:hypothetical protein